jgi:hypothetical protein
MLVPCKETQQDLSVQIPLDLWAAFLPAGYRAGPLLRSTIRQDRSENFLMAISKTDRQKFSVSNLFPWSGSYELWTMENNQNVYIITS